MTFLKPLIDRASLKNGRALLRDNDGQLGVEPKIGVGPQNGW